MTNLTTSVGDYATTGKPVLAIVDTDSFYVYARAKVELMAGKRLAQRAPVRIALGPVPQGVRLIAGLTAAATLVADKPTGRRHDLQELSFLIR